MAKRNEVPNVRCADISWKCSLRAARASSSAAISPWKLLTENTVDASKEKHVPAIEKMAGGFKVKVGSVAHPMEEKHYIEWIEVIADGKAYRQYLAPGQAPEAFSPSKPPRLQPGNTVICTVCGKHKRKQANFCRKEKTWPSYTDARYAAMRISAPVLRRTACLAARTWSIL